MDPTNSPPSSHSRPATAPAIDRASLAREIQERLGLPQADALGLAASLMGALREALARAPRSAERPASPPVVNEENASELADRALAAAPPYPAERFRGRGIVTCAGGARYFPCAWVCIHRLRASGCQLPIQMWHLGPEEIDERMRELVRPLGVECVDALEVRREHPVRVLNGWELKPFSILHSRFEEVLFLDADNVPLVDPGFLFEAPEYRGTGAIFWPDAERLGPEHRIWGICRVPYRDEAEIESGQIVVDKRRCWRALQLTMHLNEHSDFYYRHIHGDKETFHMAWRMLGQEYSMVPAPMSRLRGVMCQHDFTGRRIFQHRLIKWDRRDFRVEGFEREDECLDLLARLDEVWDGSIEPGPGLEDAR
jgi:hypothetical protein